MVNRKHVVYMDKIAIAELNDMLRQTMWGGDIIATQGILRLPADTIEKVFNAVRDYDSFTPDNDPHGEHDFGSLVVAGHSVYWKIDYYDQRRAYVSRQPACPDVTTRVLTIMLSEEY